MRRLIINADDFGLTNGINRGILDSHRRGIVTSATLMAQAPGSPRAAALSTAYPGLSVGCHIVLVDGTPVLDPKHIFSLVKHEGTNAACFRPKLSSFALHAMMGRLDPEHVQAEATAQIRCLQEHGIRVTHFDTHKHTHIFPAVLRPLLRAAKASGIVALRNPFGPRLPASLGNLSQRPRLWKRLIEVKVLSAFASSFRRTIADFGMRAPDGSFGVIATGALDLELFRLMVDAIPEGTWEFICHPGYNDRDLALVSTRLRESRETELEVFTSAAAREAIERRGIQLISYGEL
ncbi:MAG: ChbG/HpnK family deacetylase [Acidobacteria bacterium]|nr:ChbG/HpnK family deacetylase [Acidobacteriota bacterium]